MIDGKIGNIILGTPATNCLICISNPKAMNNVKSHSEIGLDSEALIFAIYSLHALIKCIECFLRTSYKLDIKSGKDQMKIRRL